MSKEIGFYHIFLHGIVIYLSNWQFINWLQLGASKPKWVNSMLDINSLRLGGIQFSYGGTFHTYLEQGP